MKAYTLLYLAVLLLCGHQTAQALPRTQAQMAQAAAEALNAHRSEQGRAPRRTPVQTLQQQGLLTVMGYAEGGFAIVTADDLLPAVVALSDKSYDADCQPEGYTWWLSAMDEAARYYVAHQQQARVVRPDASRFQPYVRPLLSTEWGQEEPFNNACPLLPDAELYPRHCVVGCVATATAQILNYHQWPTTGHGTTTLRVPYGSATGTDYTMDFAQCHFDWANMRNTYTVGNYSQAEANAVAQLSHAMGMMAVMQYGLDFSGAISDDAEQGLQNYFGISTATLCSRNDVFGMSENYTEQQWADMIFQALSTVGPVYYAGADADDQGGHAFVVDGYNQDGLVHVNWGWHGRFDGYYDVSILNPRVYHFSKGQEMILGIAPPAKAKGMTHDISVSEPGTLGSLLHAVEQQLGTSVSIEAVAVRGPLSSDDISQLRSRTSLTAIDLSGARLPSDSLPARAFYGCSRLRTLLLPDAMRHYGDAALAGCSNLNTLQLPAGGEGASYRAEGGVVYTADRREVIAVLPTAEDSVTIADGVTAIHASAFEGCKYVRIVTLPASVTTLADRAFACVPIMRELHVASATPAAVGTDTFLDVDPGFVKLFLPAGSRQAYEQAEGWSTLFRSDNVTEVGTVIRARDITRSYGEDVDEYYFEIIGQRVKGLPRLSCAATKTSPAGQYPIVVERGSVEDDDVTFVNGTLTVVGGPAGLNDIADGDAAETFHLGYCNGEVADKSQRGAMGNGHTSAAIFLPASMLSALGGSSITAVRVGLATRLNIDELSVWVRTSLDGQNLAEGTVNRRQTRVQQGWNEVALATAYTIPQQCEGLYVGYTYHHTSVANAVSLVGTTPQHTAFFRQNDEAEWQDVSDEGAVSLEAVVSGTQLTQYDLVLSDVTLSPDLSAGFTDYQLQATVTNMGTRDVSGFDVTVQAEGAEAVTTYVAQAVASGRQQRVSFTFASTAAIAGAATATVSRLDNGTDQQPQNNSAQATVALQRHVLLEEFTTESCPNCPGGAELMHEALQSNSLFADRVHVVCHHSAFNTDWLTQPCDVDYTWMFNEDGQTYAPAWMIDRQPFFTSNIASGNTQAIYFTTDARQFSQLLDGALQQQAHVAVGVSAVVRDGKAVVTVRGLRDDQLAASTRLTVYLTEDDIAARSQQSHEGVVSGYRHQHVIRAYNSSWGDVIEWDGDTFTRSFEFPMAADWKVADLRAVAVVSNYDAADNLRCAVENSAAATVGTVNGVGTLWHQTTTGRPAAYTLGGQRVGERHRGLVIERRADGTTVKRWR